MASILAFFRRLLHLLGLGGRAQQDGQASAPSSPASAPPGSPAPVETPTLGAGKPAPVSPTLALPQLMAIAGQFPSRGGTGSASFTQGMVQSFAGFVPAYGAPRAEGQTYAIAQNQALVAIIGMNFGGDPPMRIAIPNLNGRVAVGGQEIGMFGPGKLVMTWLIATGASAVPPVPGMLAMFGGNYAPDGWAICDGTLMAIVQNVPLFEAIGAAFGGNGETNFALPNLNGGAAPVGAGQGPGRPAVTVGQQVAGPIPGLGANYLISTAGAFPPGSGTGAFPETGQYLGQVIAFAGAQAPAGWALCDGSLQQISGNPPLFELIGTTYGGDGQSTFALPDLRGRMVTGLAG